jgi:adenosylmethionine-8-amino-7-oxononanoate aminotransferase
MLDGVAEMDEVVEVRGRGFMVGIDLGEHDPALRVGQRVAREARLRGAVIRPLGNVIVLMPPLSISTGDLQRLVEITADSIEAAVAGAHTDAVTEADTAEMAAAVPLREAA